MQSVFEQTFTDYEYIIIDGGSTDGSREYIEQHKAKLAYWVSEKDGGIYNAMNKGIVSSNSLYLLFLNSGDSFAHRGILKEVFDKELVEDIIYCDVCDELTGKVIRFPDSLRFSFMKFATINHQSTFIKRELFFQCGFYNEDFKIVSDWEFFMKCIFLYNVCIKHIGIILTKFDFYNGLSTNIRNQELLSSEREKVLAHYFERFLADYEEMENIKRQLQIRINNSLRVNRRMIYIIRKCRKATLKFLKKW